MSLWRNAVFAAVLLAVAGSASAQRRPAVTPEQREAAERALAEHTSPTLTRFSSDDEFRRYLGAVLAMRRARYGWASSRVIQFAQAQQADVQSDTVEPIC